MEGLIDRRGHIAPSYRRLSHPTWTTCISLLLDLLLGAGKTRYLCTRPTARHQREVFVRGFSPVTPAVEAALHWCSWKTRWHCMPSRALEPGSLVSKSAAASVPLHSWQTVLLATKRSHYCKPRMPMHHCDQRHPRASRSFRQVWALLWALAWLATDWRRIPPVADLARVPWSCWP